MGNSSDPEFDQFKNHDFSDARPVPEVPALAALQAEAAKGRAPVALYLDEDIIGTLRHQAAAEGKSWQTLVNETLRAGIAAKAA